MAREGFLWLLDAGLEEPAGDKASRRGRGCVRVKGVSGYESTGTLVCVRMCVGVGGVYAGGVGSSERVLRGSVQGRMDAFRRRSQRPLNLMGNRLFRGVRETRSELAALRCWAPPSCLCPQLLQQEQLAGGGTCHITVSRALEGHLGPGPPCPGRPCWRSPLLQRPWLMAVPRGSCCPAQGKGRKGSQSGGPSLHQAGILGMAKEKLTPLSLGFRNQAL